MRGQHHGANLGALLTNEKTPDESNFGGSAQTGTKRTVIEQPVDHDKESFTKQIGGRL